jgi:hypothetical protein
MYEGNDPEERRAMIEGLGYPGIEVLTLDKLPPLDQLDRFISPESEACIFWADDDKPVRPDFLQQMVRPLFENGSGRAALHLWSGNAVAVPRSALQSIQGGNFKLLRNSFMSLALFFLDVGSASEGMRAHVAFSSTERLAPLCAEPVGLPS